MVPRVYGDKALFAILDYAILNIRDVKIST